MKNLTIILFFLLFTSSVYSVELLDITKLSDDVTLLRLSEQFEYSTSLSEDKKNLTIELIKVSNRLEKNNIKLRSKIQKEIFVNKNGNNLKLNLILNSPSGFNTYKLPYSNSLLIENFDWDLLTDSDESYRDGLFAYESMLYDVAIQHLKSSDSTKQSSGILGLIYLFQDSVQKGYKELITAARYNNYLPDVYAALSQIHLQKGDTTKAKYYEQRFLDKLNISEEGFDYPKLIFKTENLNFEDVSELIDSSDADLANINKTNDRFSNLFDTVNTKSKNEIETGKSVTIGSNTTVLKNYMVYILLALFIIVLLILAYYLKWRKLKLDKQKELAKSSFEQELQKEANTNKPSPIVYNKTIGKDKVAKRVSKKVNNNEFSGKSNFNLKSIEEKINYKDSLNNISLENKSNVKLESIEKMNESSKSKLFRKYFVKNK